MTKRRRYGYTKKTKGGAKKTRSRGKLLRTEAWWISVLLAPIKVTWWALVMLWTFSVWVRKKIPHMSSGTKEEVRQKIIWGGLGGAVLLFIFGTITVAWVSKDLPDPDRLTDRKVAQSTKIYDHTGEHLLYEIFTDQRRTVIEYEDIPEQLINAVIATEDTKFYEHKGIRPLSILRAVVFGVFTTKRISGTSTLTQQLVKNAILTNERSILRKIKEAILSIRLEQKYTKKQILKIYFNEIPYGSTNYGVEAASLNYFGKSTNELNLQELATLAGLPKAPSRYLKNKDALKERRDFVLRRMHDEGYITKEEKESAQAEEVTLEQRFDNIRAPHFVLHVKEQLVEMFGENMVNTEGLNVLTTLDWEKQEAAEKAFEEVGQEKLTNAEANNASLVALNPTNGHIVSMVGSADFFNEEIDGQFNVATQGLRQPGSSFKPIVYTAAFEKGYTPSTVLFDVVTNFAASGKDYKPLNYNLKELGPVSMRQALQGSLNIPAVKALYLVGAKKGVDFAERLGYSTLSEGSFGLSLVLGGGEVKLLEHVSAYGVFANEGVRHEAVSIVQVEDRSGDVLYKWKQKRGERVLDKKITATISNVLSDDSARAFAFGTGGVLTLPGRPVAAKTGTTNAYVDAWTVGYTPDLVAGVWAGNTDNTPMKRGYGGSKVAGPIWKAFMTEALIGSPVKGFPNPPENDAKKPALLGSAGGNITLSINNTSGRRATSSTPEHLIVQRTYIQPHSILHYVKKDNPRGPSPKNPSDDPQYTIWETAIQDWITRKKEEEPDWDISFEEPPTELDDEYSMELQPTLELVYPIKGETIFSRQIDTDVRVGAPRGVAKVTYKIDDAWVGVVREHPFNLNYYAKGLTPGEHTLVVLVEDDVGNRLEERVPFTLMADIEKPSVYWADAPKTISQNKFPRTLFFDHYELDKIKQVTVTGKHNGNTEVIKIIEDFSDLFNNQISFQWKNTPEKGEWLLETEIKLDDGGKHSGPSIKVSIN